MVERSRRHRTREEHGKLTGDVVVSDRLVLYGVVEGDVTVLGGDLEVHGAVLGDVLVVTGAAGLHGTVTGHVHNEAGEVVVTGVVHDGLSVRDGAEAATIVAPGAMVVWSPPRRLPSTPVLTLAAPGPSRSPR